MSVPDLYPAGPLSSDRAINKSDASLALVPREVPCFSLWPLTLLVLLGHDIPTSSPTTLPHSPVGVRRPLHVPPISHSKRRSAAAQSPGCCLLCLQQFCLPRTPASLFIALHLETGPANSAIVVLNICKDYYYYYFKY